MLPLQGVCIPAGLLVCTGLRKRFAGVAPLLLSKKSSCNKHETSFGIFKTQIVKPLPKRPHTMLARIYMVIVS